MFNMYAALVLAFCITVVIAPPLIRYLKRLKFGQSILEIGPSWHKQKQGTPTMGGIMFIFAALAASAALCRLPSTFIVLAMALCYGFIGFIDDYIKVVKKRNLGLRARQKMLLQILAACGFLWSLHIAGIRQTSLYIPFASSAWELSWFYYPLAVFLIVGVVNSVNLTDGIDGLAAGVSIPVFIFFAAVSITLSNYDTGALCAALIGACLGFLVFNFHPARVFMGDTGSLFLGGAISALGFLYGIPALLILVCLVFEIESISVIMQVISFKTTGKRIFKMSPLHHHFEMSGWKEVHIVYVFTAVTIICCVIAFIALTRFYIA